MNETQIICSEVYPNGRSVVAPTILDKVIHVLLEGGTVESFLGC
jgi:hypothetical protein